jgi:hypothetical protein
LTPSSGLHPPAVDRRLTGGYFEYNLDDELLLNGTCQWARVTGEWCTRTRIRFGDDFEPRRARALAAASAGRPWNGVMFTRARHAHR